MRVVLAARDEGRSAGAVDSLRGDEVDASSTHLDVADPASVAAASAWLAREYGRLDILVNNAGILPEARMPAAEKPLDP